MNRQSVSIAVLLLVTLGLFLGLLAGEKSNPAPTPWKGQGALPTSTARPELLVATGTPWWQEDLPTLASLHTSTPTTTTPTPKP